MMAAADRPPEARGLARDDVRLLVATPDGLAHRTFRDLGHFLAPGDLLVVNTSATISAAVDGTLRGQHDRAIPISGPGPGDPVTVHFSTPLDDGSWLVELREAAAGRGRMTGAEPGDKVALPASASLTLIERYPDQSADRMWTALVTIPPARSRGTASVAADADRTGAARPDPARPDPARPGAEVLAFLARHGRPIRYSYVPDPWPLTAYQTVFARDPGSAEMPSAGRPFSPDLVTSLVARGVVFAPITLHAGVASLEAGELPLPERFAVPEPTARLVNLTRAAGNRVVAVGTTVTRALETAAGADGTVRGARGWTDLVLGTARPARAARVVTGLITGWHDPDASHLALLEAVAGPVLIRAAYIEADKEGYLGHEFGDSCLLLPPL
jgi:S-adenosylmethionine:tRNA ribosyltransferase-isomerase